MSLVLTTLKRDTVTKAGTKFMYELQPVLGLRQQLKMLLRVKEYRLYLIRRPWNVASSSRLLLWMIARMPNSPIVSRACIKYHVGTRKQLLLL